MQIERLIKIIMILLNRENVTAKKLAEEFGVSIRTIYRDLDALSLANIPLYTSRGRNGGINLLSEFTLNRAMLSQAEQFDMMTALRSMKSIGGLNIENVLDKMGALFKDQKEAWLEVDTSGWGCDNSDLNKFTDIKYAVTQKKVLEFSYADSYGNLTKREAEPLKLVYKGSAWYMIAFCRVKSDYRNFRLSRIYDIHVTETAFVRQMSDGLSIDMPAADAEFFIELRLKFASIYAYRVYDDFKYDDIIRNSDGSLEVKAAYPLGEWVYGYIMSFGGGVEVLEPDYIRDEIRSRFETALSKYQNYN